MNDRWGDSARDRRDFDRWITRGQPDTDEDAATEEETTMTPEKLAEICARAAHEQNNVYNAAIGDSPSPAWDALTEPQRNGVIGGATHALNGGTPEASHEL